MYSPSPFDDHLFVGAGVLFLRWGLILSTLRGHIFAVLRDRCIILHGGLSVSGFVDHAFGLLGDG